MVQNSRWFLLCQKLTWFFYQLFSFKNIGFREQFLMSTFLTSFEPIYFVKMSLIFSVRYSSISNSMTFSFKPGHTVRKSRNITEQNRSPIFFYVVLKMLWNIMEKELTSCMGVLLRADLTGQGHPTLFGRNRLIGWIGYALLGQPLKGHPCRILILFP